MRSRPLGRERVRLVVCGEENDATVCYRSEETFPGDSVGCFGFESGAFLGDVGESPAADFSACAFFADPESAG